ncbi:retron St85 family RNA-directed DNA polymerase [Pectobacterium sp. CHL-2024]|uniref:retron St85 family RNA-directed DNA polymerase n=1 Tax=Pectobacterium sp. CHL-2024 TaxID=3377079 RepID=UPI00382101FD
MLIEAFSKVLGKSEHELLNFIINAPDKYKLFTIPKRKHGNRLIAQPSKELKHYQRQIGNLILFPIHDAAMAYCKGKSIRDNALFHANNSYLLKMDLENFFNSITPDLFWNVWSQTWDLPDNNDAFFIERLIFWRFQGELILSVGAPSSPLISNFCMYYFDKKVQELCNEKYIIYSRYADDLTFSSNVKNILFEIPKLITELLDDLFGGALRVNRSKTIYSSKAHNRHVTGITLNNFGQLSLGRERKRYIKHMVHQYTLNVLGVNEIQHLKGLISFSAFIEPSFLQSLKIKYTHEVIINLLEENHEQS